MTGMLNYQRTTGITSAHADAEDLRIRGLLHDLGHQLLTLSLLTESIPDDSATSADTRQRMKLVMTEMFRAVDLMSDVLPAGRDADDAPSVDVRALAGEATQLAALTHETTVRLLPGRPVRLQVGPRLLWRVLTNLIDNAARAAGPAGLVEVAVDQQLDTAIEIADTGPGFGSGPPGRFGLGISVVRQLLSASGGRLEIADRPGGGACVRVIFGRAGRAVAA